MEIWKDIQNYKGIYQASDIGRIKSLDRYINVKGRNPRFVKGRILKYAVKQMTPNYKRAVVSLCRYGKCKSFFVHRLVLEAFVLNPLNKPQVNHKDSNSLNNKLSNLEWVTAKENTQHAIDNGRYIHHKDRDDSNVINDYLKGLLMREVAVKHNITTSIVLWTLIRNNIPRRKKGFSR